MKWHSVSAHSFAEYNFLLCAVPPTFSNFIYIYYFIKIKILYKDSERGGTWHNTPQTRINSRFLLCHPVFAKWHRGPKWHTKCHFLPIFEVFFGQIPVHLTPNFYLIHGTRWHTNPKKSSFSVS